MGTAFAELFRPSSSHGMVQARVHKAKPNQGRRRKGRYSSVSSPTSTAERRAGDSASTPREERKREIGEGKGRHMKRTIVLTAQRDTHIHTPTQKVGLGQAKMCVSELRTKELA